jgi:hypothetical protein
MTIVARLKQQHRNVLDYLTKACDAANWGRHPHLCSPGDAVVIG